MANKWDDATREQRLRWALAASVSEYFRTKKWDEIPKAVRENLARYMKGPHRGSRCGCGDWDCGIHTPCYICGDFHSPGSNCY
jgi:hypothetical protein